MKFMRRLTDNTSLPLLRHRHDAMAVETAQRAGAQLRFGCSARSHDVMIVMHTCFFESLSIPINIDMTT